MVVGLHRRTAAARQASSKDDEAYVIIDEGTTVPQDGEEFDVLGEGTEQTKSFVVRHKKNALEHWASAEP